MSANDPIAAISSTGINDSATATAIGTIKTKLLANKTTSAAYAAAQSLNEVIAKLLQLGV